MNLYCYLWSVGDEVMVYTTETTSLLQSLIDLIRHEPVWAGFEFRALEDYLIHSDDKVQAPRKLGDKIFVYYL